MLCWVKTGAVQQVDSTDGKLIHMRAQKGHAPLWLRRPLNFLHRPWRDIGLVVQVYLLLGITRLAINTLPFTRLEKWLGQRLVETANEAPLADLRQARKIGWAIRAVSPYTPWKSNCFPQALTAKLLLRRRGIPSTLYMGVAFKQEENAALEGHAWLRCGPLFVTGGDGSKRFGAVATFGG